MITARFFQENGGFAGFSVSGHAGYAEYGSDIACASVTSAVQTASNIITEAAGVKADVRVKGSSVELELPGSMTQTEAAVSRAVLKGLHMQLMLLAEQFRGRIRVVVTDNRT